MRCECFIRRSAEIKQLFTEGRVVGGGRGTSTPQRLRTDYNYIITKRQHRGAASSEGFPCFLRNWARSRNCIGAGLLRFENGRAVETNTPHRPPMSNFHQHQPTTKIKDIVLSAAYLNPLNYKIVDTRRFSTEVVKNALTKPILTCISKRLMKLKINGFCWVNKLQFSIKGLH